MKTLRKLLSMTLALALMLGASLAAAETEISMWADYTGPDGEVMTKQIAKYNDLDNGVKLDFSIVPNDQLQEKMPVAVATGTGPTMSILMTYEVAAYLDAGLLIPMEDFFEKTGMKREDFLDGTLDVCTFDGTLYGIPQDLSGILMYWNKDLFEKAGLDPETPPATWDEVFEFAAKINDPENGVYGVALAATGGSRANTCLLRSYGGDLFDMETGLPTVNSTENIEAFTLLQEKVYKPGLTPYHMTDTQAICMAGSVGIFFGGPWLVSGCNESGLNWGMANMPSGPVTAGGSSEGGVYVVFKNNTDEEVAAAYDYIRHSYEEEVRVAWATTTGFPPSTVAAAENAAVADNPIIRMSGQSIVGANTPYPNGLTCISELENSVFNPMMERIENGEDVATVLAEAQEMATQVLNSH